MHDWVDSSTDSFSKQRCEGDFAVVESGRRTAGVVVGGAGRGRAVRLPYQPQVSHKSVVLFFQNKSATSNQSAVLFSQKKPAPAIRHQPNEPAGRKKTRGSNRFTNVNGLF
jgi:hypothetical protein